MFRVVLLVESINQWEVLKSVDIILNGFYIIFCEPVTESIKLMIKKFFKKWCWLIIWFGGTLILYLIILYTSKKIEPLPLITAEGLEIFVEIFKIPLYFFAAGIPAVGIYLAYIRMQQTNDILLQNKKQLDEIQKQREESEKNRLQSIFTEQIRLFIQFVENIHIGGFGEHNQGKNCFEEMHRNFSNLFSGEVLKDKEKSKDMFMEFFMNYKASHGTQGYVLNDYLTRTKTLFRFLHVTEGLGSLKWDLLILLRAQLSKFELIFLFYEGVWDTSFKQILLDFNMKRWVDQGSLFNKGSFSVLDVYKE